MISDKRIDDMKRKSENVYTWRCSYSTWSNWMFKVIIPKIVFKELEKIDTTDKQLVFDKLKDLEKGHFENDKYLQGKHRR